MNPLTDKKPITTYAQLLGVMFLWGGTFVSGRLLSQTYHPFVIAFYRFLFASLVLIPVMVWKSGKFPKLTWLQVLKVGLLGATGIFSYNYFFFAGLGLVEAGRASVIIAINPTITAVLASLFLKEEMTPRKFLGVLIALFGALIVITKGNLFSIFSEGLGRGELYLFGAVLSWVSYTIMGKVTLKKLTPLEATSLACTTGTFFLLPFAFQHGLEEFPFKANFFHWFNIAFLGIFATALGFIWYYDGIRRIGAAKAAAFINFVPLFGMTLGAVFLGEKPALSLLGGAVFVILGVSLANLSQLPFKLKLK